MKYPTKLLFAASLSLGAVCAAVADDDDDEGRFYTAGNPAWQAECGSCHIAYPPQMLPARSWRALMADLSNHFGTDASVDDRAATEIADFLQRNAGRDRNPNTAPVLRITETRWFRGEHGEVPARTWRNTKVQSPSNCAACHVDAERGGFREGSIRLPR